MALLGGVSSPIGSTIGTGLLILIPEWLRFLKSVQGLYLAVCGLAVILIVVFMPEGIWGFVGRLFRTRNRSPLESAEPFTLCPGDTGAPIALEVRGLAKNFGGLVAISKDYRELEGKIEQRKARPSAAAVAAGDR